MNFSQVIEWFKISNTHLFAIVIGCSIVLFTPESFLRKLGLFSIKEAYLTIISVSLLLALSMLSARGCAGIIAWIKQRFIWHKNLKEMRKRLNDLTPEEKQILQKYILGNTRTQDLLIQDGVANGLVAAKILYRSANVGSMMGGFAFNIQPWAWVYLKENPYLLED
jgi:hypothetical protein